MRAIVLRRNGPPRHLVLESWPDPAPGPGQVLIRVRAAGVNFADVLARQGLYPDAPRHPYVPGYESSGDVLALGPGVEGLDVGDRVLAYHESGGYAEMVAAAAENVLPIPESLSYQSAVVLPLNYGTAYTALYRTGPVERGMHVFIHAAAGGVGLAAVDLCRRAGLTMSASASTHFKRSRLQAAGVKRVVSSKRIRTHRLARSLAGGPAFDIILNSIGGPSLGSDLNAVRPGGRVVSLGVGQISRRGPLRALWYLLRTPRFSSLRMLRSGIGLCGVNLRMLLDDPPAARAVLARLVEWTVAGEIDPEPGRVLALEDAAEAHRILESRGNAGKIVLRTA